MSSIGGDREGGRVRVVVRCAIQIAASIAANYGIDGIQDDEFADEAVRKADALLARLAKEPQS